MNEFMSRNFNNNSKRENVNTECGKKIGNLHRTTNQNEI